MPHITHPNGQTTYYLDDSPTDPSLARGTILIQHGFARHSAFWQSWIPVLTKYYRVIRRDARGHGHSSAPSKDYIYSIDGILDEIIDTLDQLGLEKVHYLGESTGGIFGEFLAARNPGRVASLAICSSPLYMPAEAQDMLAFGHASWAEACRVLGSRGWGEAVAKVLGTDQTSDRAFYGWWLDQISVSSGEGLGDHAELLCQEEFDARRIMMRINVPMLMLSPASSQLVNLEEQKMLRDATGAKMEVIDGVGHEVYLDQAEVCQSIYLEFLGSLK